MCEHTVCKKFPKDNELFDNGGWDHVDPKPHSAEELLALKKQQDRIKDKDYMSFINDHL